VTEAVSRRPPPGRPHLGSVRWNGLDAGTDGQAIRARLGYLPQQFGVYSEFSGRRFLGYLAALKGLAGRGRDRRVDEVLELVNLEADADSRLSTYSGDMLRGRHRLGAAQRPGPACRRRADRRPRPLPARPLPDPAGRATANRLVILSTHVVSDVDAVGGRLVAIRGGAVLADTSPAQLLASAAGSVWAVRRPGHGGAGCWTYRVTAR
jgi:ABC-2 type transport system ATP-binding protein